MERRDGELEHPWSVGHADQWGARGRWEKVMAKVGVSGGENQAELLPNWDT